MKTKLMYLGERVDLFRGVHQEFKDKSGSKFNWTGIKNLYFGAVVEAERKGKSMTMSRRPQIVESDWQPTEQEEVEYEAHKVVVRAYRQSRKKAMELKRPNQNIVRAVELLKPFYRAMDHFSQKRFMEWIANACSKPKGKV